MPRTLPWLTGVAQSRKASNSPLPEIERSGIPKVKDETPTRREPSSSKRDFLRSSPSPPSSPIHSYPSEEFLVEGLDKDDIYVMVEDELYTVAQTFTRHLHYAEYVRRKKEAKIRNDAAVQDLARRTDGVTSMSEELKKKYAAQDLSARQKEGLDQVLGKQARDEPEEDDVYEESTWAGTSLHDLMLSPRRARSLVGIQRIKSTTRAAAGFAPGLKVNERSNDDSVQNGPTLSDETGNEEEEEDDDLDLGAPAPPALRAVIRRQDRVLLTSPSSSSSPTVLRPTEDIKGKLRDTKFGIDFSTTVKRQRRFAFDDFDELPELRKPTLKPQKRRLDEINTQQKKPKDKDTEPNKSRLNEVPTFLI